MNHDQDYLDTKIGSFHKDPSVSTIYVGNLDYNKDEFQIRDMFEDYGYVNYVKIIKDQQTHESRGIAFVQMPSRTHAVLAISELNGAQIDGRYLKASMAVESNTDRINIVDDVKKTKKPRRKPYKAYTSKADRVKPSKIV